MPNPPDLSSYLSKHIEGEISRFPSSTLYNSLDHEDVSICNLEIYDCGCRDIFIDSFDHDYDFSIAELSKPPIFDDPSYGELELLQAIEAFQPELIVMLVSRSLEINSTSD